MALDEVQRPGWVLTLTKASVVSGDPIAVGQITGVAIVSSYTDANGVANQVQTDTGPTVYNLSVKGVITGPANSAVAVGDAIYLNAGHTPVLDKDTGGILFGYALGTVGSGLTATILVRHVAL